MKCGDWRCKEGDGRKGLDEVREMFKSQKKGSLENETILSDKREEGLARRQPVLFCLASQSVILQKGNTHKKQAFKTGFFLSSFCLCVRSRLDAGFA